jgi:hypothetical protein
VRGGRDLDLVQLGSSVPLRTPSPVASSNASRWPALAVQPSVLLLDEPLSALDAKVRTTLRDEIRRIQTDVGITTLFVTHDQEEALAISDRICVMSQGNIEQLGTPTEVYRRPTTAFVARFVGTMNEFTAEVTGPGGRSRRSSHGCARCRQCGHRSNSACWCARKTWPWATTGCPARSPRSPPGATTSCVRLDVLDVLVSADVGSGKQITCRSAIDRSSSTAPMPCEPAPRDARRQLSGCERWSPWKLGHRCRHHHLPAA